MKLNLLIATTLFTLCAAGGYAQVTINQEANIAEAMELKKEVARNESAFQSTYRELSHPFRSRKKPF